MSFQEKRSSAHLFSIVLVAVGFYVYVFQWNVGEAFGDTGSYAFWAWALLAVIPVQIATHIVITILFTIGNTIATKREEPDIMDERDKIIEFRAMRNTFSVFMIAFAASLVLILFEMPLSYMFGGFLGGLLLSQMVWTISQFYYYRRGY